MTMGNVGGSSVPGLNFLILLFYSHISQRPERTSDREVHLRFHPQQESTDTLRRTLDYHNEVMKSFTIPIGLMCRYINRVTTSGWEEQYWENVRLLETIFQTKFR